MYVVGYRYRVPEAARESYVALQKKVAGLYMQAGASRYVVLRPRNGYEQFAEFTFYESKQTADEVERKLSQTGALDEQFREFVRLTGLSERDLTPIEYDVTVAEER